MAMNSERNVTFTIGGDSDVEDDIKIENLHKARESVERAKELAKTIKTGIVLTLILIPLLVIWCFGLKKIATL